MKDILKKQILFIGLIACILFLGSCYSQDDAIQNVKDTYPNATILKKSNYTFIVLEKGKYYNVDCLDFRNDKISNIKPALVIQEKNSFDLPEEWPEITTNRLLPDTMLAWKDSTTGVVHIEFKPD